MSANYTCNQFDAAYRPTRLGNWEVPKWHLNRPKGRTVVTKVIANDRGHLLPGVQKTDQKHWAGLYLGTYQLPKRITKEIAMELSNPKCQTWMKRSYHHPFIARDEKDNDKPENEQNVCGDEWKTKPEERTNEETANNRESIESVKSAMSLVPTAADVSAFETLRKCASADDVSAARSIERGKERRASSAAHTPSSPALSRISVAGSGPRPAGTTATAAERPADRRYCEDAHRHQGLPDTIEDAVYRSLQTKRHKYPGLGLEGCWPECSAVAYKSFNDPGPTQCSKLRVYRPKTSSSAGDAAGARKELPTGRRRGTAGELLHSPRPKTSVPVVTAQQLTDIKLALCWDLDAPFDRNARSSDRPAVFHGGTDGNGKLPPAAPPQNSSAVMGFVQAAPTERRGDRDVVPEAQRMQTRECLLKNRNLSAVMELIPNKDRGGCEPSAAETERSGDVAAVDRIALSDKPPSGCRSKSGSAAADGAKTGGNPVAADVHNDSFDDIRPRRRRRRRKSLDDALQCGHKDAADNEPKNHRQPPRQALRPCLACDDPDAVAAANCGRKEPRECGHYKMAFKAGVPVSTPVRNRAGKPGRHQQLKVPKPRTTNSDKKKYVIGTLLPPFSMWPGTTARDYPEHWRLTSVYRQAFKPLELRKQPFLQTIYL